MKALPHAVFTELPLTAAKPAGWLRRLLESQRDGLTGHLDSIGYPFDTEAWKSPRVSKTWEPYEQNAYWIDGMVRLGHVLGSKALVAKAKDFLDRILDEQDPDGYLGPHFLKRTYPQALVRSKTIFLAAYYYGFQRWPLAVLFRAFMADHQAGGDARIPRALLKHFLNDPADYSVARCVMNIEVMAWLYAVTGDVRIRKLAEHVFARKQRLDGPEAEMSLENMLNDKRMTSHGVTFNEEAKLGAIMFLMTGRKAYLQASINAFEKLERDHMLVDGVPSSEEHLSGKAYLGTHETCNVTDYSWSCGYLLMATGDPVWADRIERAVFNAAMGSIKKDFTAIQYFSAPNQVIATTSSDQVKEWKGDERMAYMPIHGQYCCAGNVNRFLPNYASRMWMCDDPVAAQLISAVLYGPSELKTTVGRQRIPLTITQRTGYPFSERIEFVFQPGRRTAFMFSMRIPAWCDAPEVALNGERIELAITTPGFVSVERAFSPGDRIVLTLPMQVRVKPHAGIGWYVERGPLLYALKIKEKWTRSDDYRFDATEAFPIWDVTPQSPFSYALAFDPADAADAVEVVKTGATGDPWLGTPIELRLPARRIRNVDLERCAEVTRNHVTTKGDFAFTPDLPDAAFIRRNLAAKVERITLVPYGTTHLRATIFPLAG